MAARFRLSGLLLLLLVATIGLKLPFLGGWTYRGQVPQIPVKAEIAGFLTQNGFAVTEPADELDFQILAAASGRCNLLVALAAPQGWHTDAIRRLARPGDAVSYVFEGTIYADQPVWLTWTSFYGRWLLRFAGIRLPMAPVLGVVSSPGCDVQAVPWGNVATIQAQSK